MTLETDLSRKPYFDDFDEDKNFHQVLYRPAAAVQARELNQSQSILQDQINKFGRHIFKDGSVVEGCSFTFDNDYNYVKIEDNYSNNFTISNIQDLSDRIVRNSNGLEALVVNTVGGFQSQDPDLNTLYIKYLNATTYPNGASQSVFANGEILQVFAANTLVSNVVVATVANSTGKGYAFTTTEGVIFKKGYFIRVAPQTLIVSKYNNLPTDISVGFNAVEEIVTPEIDTSLLDNAAGSPNFEAPGAHRLKLVPTLVTRTTSAIDAASFFSLCDFQNGLPISIKNDPQYAALGREQAKRTYETNGDYVVNPFFLNSSKKQANTTHLNLVVSPGIGYVKGNRVEYINNVTVPLRKGTDFTTATNQNVTANFGYYFRVTQYCGDFNTDQIASVELHSQPKLAISRKIVANVEYIGTATGYNNTDIITVSNGAVNATATVTTNNTGGSLTFSISESGLFPTSIENNNLVVSIANSTGGSSSGTGATFSANLITSRAFLGATYSTSTKIGTAYVRGVAYESGTPGVDATYLLYIFNLRMDPGFSVGDAKSLIYYDSTLKAVADIVLTFDAASNSNTARIQEATGELMVYPLGQKAIKPDGITNQEFIYRNKSSANFTTSGNATITITTTVAGGTDAIIPTGNYSGVSKQSVLVVPTVNGFSTNLAGGITAYSTNTSVVGNATATFLSSYTPGDYIRANNETRRVVSIINNTSMFVDAAFNTNTAANVVHQKAYPAGVPINLLSTNRTVNATSSTITITLENSMNAAFASTFYYNINRESNVPVGKVINKGRYVRIDLSNNAAGTTGPWCLGVPDVLKVNHVYVGTSGSYDTSNPDLVSFFNLDNGQRDAHYDLAYISSNRLFSNNTSLLVELDHFTTDTSQGAGFFTAKSYPIDDANTANTSAIQTYQIPTYTSKSTKTFIDLRDAIDFRPWAVNTGVTSTTIASATINPSNTLTLFSYDSAGAYLPTPDSSYEASIQYYLARKDRIALTTTGEVLVTEGAPSVNPKLPSELPGTMTIGTADVAPYPSLDVVTARVNSRYDYAVQVNSQQTKRYTMSDIGTIAKRVDNLEYYTSLSLIEQAATNLLVRSSVTGENRFKNGILVDPFRDHTIGNTLNPAYKIAIDPNRNELRPAASISMLPVVFDSVASTNVVKVGDIITLAYGTTMNQFQRAASTAENLIAGGYYGYRGALLLSPPGDTSPDFGVNPDVLNNVDLNSNWVNIPKAWSTQWGAWTPLNLATGPSAPTTETATSQTTTTTGNQTQLINSQLTAQSTDTNLTVGDFVTNVSLSPYLKSQFVYFIAVGLKPFARVYPYFADVLVGEICMPLRSYTGTTTVVNGITVSVDNNLPVTADTYGNIYEYNFNGTTWGSALTADVEGTVRGVMRIPRQTFGGRDTEFKLVDTPTLTVSGVSTIASAVFYASPLSVQSERINLQVRPLGINTQEVSQITDVQQTTISNVGQNISNSLNTVEQPPILASIVPDPDPALIEGGFWRNGGGDSGGPYEWVSNAEVAAQLEAYRNDPSNFAGAAPDAG